MGWTGNSSANWEMGYFKTIRGKGWEMGRVKMGEHWSMMTNSQKYETCRKQYPWLIEVY